MTLPVSERRTQALASKLAANKLDTRLTFWRSSREEANRLIQAARRNSLTDTANRAWFLASFSDAKRKFLTAYKAALRGEFYESWRILEGVEIELKGLATNAFFDLDTFGIPNFRILVENWQNLYPYRVFFSPEFKILREECSICGTELSPWSGCGHRIGRVYGGEFCHGIVREATVPSISLVLHPVQKYSVAFPSGSDPFDYTAVAHVAKSLPTPFTEFSAHRGDARHPHAKFANVAPSDLCPCTSGRSYKACCLNETGVLQPHLYITVAGSDAPQEHFFV